MGRKGIRIQMKSYKLYYDVCKKQKGIIFVGILLMVINTIITLSLPFLMNATVEKLFGIRENGFKNFGCFFCIYLLVYIGQGIVNYFSTIVFKLIGNKNAKMLAKSVVSNVFKAKKTIPGQIKVGESIVVLSDDVFKLGESGILLLYRIFYAGINIIAIIFFMIKTNVFLTLLVVLTFGVMMLIQNVFNKRIEKIINKGRETSGQYIHLCNRILEDSEEHVKNGAVSYLSKRFENSIKNLLLQRLKLSKTASGIELVNTIFLVINMLIVFGIGGYFVGIGKMIISQLITFNMYSNTFAMYLSQIPELCVEKKEFDVSYSRVYRASAIKLYKEQREKVSNISKVQLEDISFSYIKGENILSGISASFEKGKIHSIEGKNGCGKSTLMGVITGDYMLETGCIYIDGIEEDMHENKMKYSEVMSEFSSKAVLYDDSILNNICFGEDIDWNKLNEVCDVVELTDWVEGLEQRYDTRINELKENLSDGQKQKIALARFLFRDRPVLVLDEFENHLDQHTKTKIMRYLNDIKKEKIIILVTHDQYSIENADVNIKL